MKARLTLYQKGLIVIAIPFVLQLLVFAWISNLLHQSEFLVAEEFHEKNVIGRSNWISAMLGYMGMSTAMYTLTTDKGCLKVYEGAKHNLTQDLKDLSDVLHFNQTQMPRLQKANELINQLTSIFDGALALPVDQGRRELVAKKPDIIKVWEQLFNLRRQILSAETRSYEMNAESVPSNQQLQQNLIYAGIAIDLLAALALLFVYSRGITNRLEILSDNAARLASKQKLHPTLSGEDEVVQLDQVFHKMADQLAAAEKQKQDFMSMISHDLRTPLGSVVGSLELIAHGRCGEISEDAAKLVYRAENNIQIVLKLISELLDIDRIEAGMINLEFKELKVADLIDTAVDVVRSTADQKNIGIITPESEASIYADEDRLQRVLVNLLGNALKFAPSESFVTISVEQTTESVELQISDQGCGIPPDFIDKVFDRFQQVSKADAQEKGGSGLGLAICKAIVEAHGGQIGVNSKLGEGSTFWFRIPVTSAVRLP